jgi:hypothetical protein
VRNSVSHGAFGLSFRIEAAGVMTLRLLCVYEGGKIMPTIRSKQTTTLKITRVKGTSSTGKDTHDYVNLSVNPELEDGDVLSIGQKLSNLQKYPVDGIGRIDASSLAEEH